MKVDGRIQHTGGGKQNIRSGIIPTMSISTIFLTTWVTQKSRGSKSSSLEWTNSSLAWRWQQRPVIILYYFCGVTNGRWWLVFAAMILKCVFHPSTLDWWWKCSVTLDLYPVGQTTIIQLIVPSMFYNLMLWQLWPVHFFLLWRKTWVCSNQSAIP